MSGTGDTWVIQAVSDLDAIRARPQAYVGATDVSGRAALALLVLQCSLGDNGPLAGHAMSATVTIQRNGGIRVDDSGHGFPPGSTDQGIPWLIEAFRAPIIGPDSSSGLSIVKALSQTVVATSRRDGEMWRVEFHGDEPVGEPECLGRTDETGTTIVFWPSDAVFSGSVDSMAISRPLRAFLRRYPGRVVTVRDEKSSGPDIVVKN